MRCLPAVILAVLLVATEGKVVPASDVESQQTGTQPLQLSDHIKEAQAVINNLGAQLQQQLNLPNQEELINTMKEQSTNLVNNVQAYLKNVSDEIKAKSPELENLWTNMKSKLSETFDNLNVNSETTEQVNQLGAKFQEGVQTLVTESENVAKTINENSSKVQEGIAKLTKQAIDIALQASQNLNHQLQQATPAPPQPQN
ncbi:apolipophorin-III-like protein [Temnothorax nylanderi]|uniref:apolipophorin-III-like protein n=1 Tax=Temnothorax nylanderi TaxID=102681 RepID=UPI003A8610B8